MNWRSLPNRQLRKAYVDSLKRLYLFTAEQAAKKCGVITAIGKQQFTAEQAAKKAK